MLFFCKTEDTETGETNSFLCSASGLPQLASFFNDDVTRLISAVTGAEMEQVMEQAVINDYDGLVLLANV